jgi:hypothetical protein
MVEGVKTKITTHRVITMLDRNELEFLDKLGKDSLFSTGHKLSYNEILRGLIGFAMQVGVQGTGINSLDTLKQKIFEIAKKKMIGQDNTDSNQAVPVERREYPRIKKDLKVECSKLESLKVLPAVNTENISYGGIQITLPEYFEPETRLELKIRSADAEKPIFAFGRVAWIKKDPAQDGFVAGIQLLHINNKERFYKVAIESDGKGLFCPDNKEIKK